MDFFYNFTGWISNRLLTLGGSRKRRLVSDEDDYFVNSKVPKMSNYDDKCSTPYRRSLISNRSRPWSKENLTINIEDDDDDDVVEVKQYNAQPNGSKRRFSSAPSDMNTRTLLNSDDDITFVSCRNVSNNRTGTVRKHSFDYSKSNTNGLDKSGTKTSQLISSILNGSNEIKTKPKSTPIARKSLHCAALNQSFRLDEKEKYKELLDSLSPHSSQHHSNFNVPYMNYTGSKKLIQGPASDRSKYLLGLSKYSLRDKPASIIDLTKSQVTNGNGRRMLIKDGIRKVLDQYDNDLIVVKDSDTDSVEILPTPPNPEPDIKVDRINSLKQIVNTIEPSKSEWLSDRTKQHRQTLDQREEDIEQYMNYVQKLHKINKDIKYQSLEARVKKCMHIKDLVLPVDLSEEEAKLTPLTNEQKEMVAVAFNRRAPPDDVLANKFNLNIKRRDLLTLSGLNWLNDEVINFYMNLIMERGKDPKWPNVYATNTFFYPKLLKDGPASLRRWTRRVDIFAHDLFVVPIHLGMHWCMAIIDFREKSIKYYDSMGGNNRKCLEALKGYLVAEHMDKKNSSYDVSNWNLVNVKDIPQQMNGSDCGMFSCTFAEFISRNAKLTFSQEDMPYLREKMVVEIITGKLLIT